MNSIDATSIDNKLSKMKNNPRSKFLVILMSALFIITSFNLGSKISLAIFITLIFVSTFVHYFVIDPLIRKIEFLDKDIKLLKEKVNIENN